MQQIVQQLRRLADEGYELRKEVRGVFSLTAHTKPAARDNTAFKVKRWVFDCHAALLFVQMMHLAKHFGGDPTSGCLSDDLLDTRLAAIESAITQIEGGWLSSIRHLLHADIFDSMVAQGIALLDAGHTIPAAVLGRIVIERWLRDQAESAGIPDYDSAKASKLNDALKGAQKYSVARWRQIQAHLDVGNAAAHGDTNDTKGVTDDNVRLLLEYARTNCL
jgi:hypothetical protein